eukprot:gene9008-23747_t
MFAELTAHIHTTIPDHQLTRDIPGNLVQLYDDNNTSSLFKPSAPRFFKVAKQGFPPTTQPLGTLVGESLLSPEAWSSAGLGLPNEAAAVDEEKKNQQHGGSSVGSFLEEGADNWSFNIEGGATPVPDAYQNLLLHHHHLGGGGGGSWDGQGQEDGDLGLTLDLIFAEAEQQGEAATMPVKDDALLLKLSSSAGDVNPVSQSFNSKKTRRAGAADLASSSTKRKQSNYRGPKNHPADAKLQSIFSTAELRMEKPQWLVLLKGHPSLTDEEVTRLKQLRRRSKCCVYAGGTREKQQAKQKMVRKEQAQLATDNASLRSEVAALQHRCQALEALVAKLAKVPPLA